MGSFNVDGRRYSLMTLEALKASKLGGGGDGGRDDDMPLPINANISTIYLDNMLHVIEPVSDDETKLDEAGNLHRLQTRQSLVADFAHSPPP